MREVGGPLGDERGLPLAAASHGLCIVTTRFALPDLRAFFGKTVREEKLTRLGRAAGVQLLKAHGVTGSDRRNLPLKDSDEHSEKLSEFEKLVEDVDGHALTLHIMGSFLKRAFQGDIRRRDRVTFAKASEKTDNGHAFRAMAAYEKWMADGSEEARRELALLSLMGLFDRPATADCLQALLQAPTIAGLTEPLVGLSEEDWNGSLTALQDASLLTVNSDAAGTLLSLDAHPLLREYFAVRLRIHAGHQAPTGRNIPAQGNALCSGIKNSGSPEGATHGADVSPLQGLRDSGAAVPGALPQAGMSRPVGAGTQLGTSEAWREAHRRLYEHLCAMTPHFPDGLEGLQPLYQAIHHGCSAGEYESACTDVLRARVRRGEKIQYSWRVLGAYASDLSAIRCFFEGDWSRLHTAISSETACWLYNAAGVRLRALGQLLDAFSPMRHGAELTVELLGKAGQPEYVSYRDDAAMRWTNLAELSIGLGKLCEAQRFAEIALSLFNETDRSYRKIPALAFQAHACICGGEFEKGMGLFRAAEELQRKSDRPTDGLFAVIGIHRINSLLISVERVAWRSIAIQTNLTGSIVIAQEIESRIAFGLLKASENSQILHCALYSERRAYCELLKSLGNNRPVSAHVVSIVEAAVRKLITAGHREHIPRGLLTRAWQRSLTGARTGPESAQSDLDEAWEIAERGPMPLFMADIHLHRARLFFREEVYPWREAKNRKGELATNRTAKDDLEDAAKLIAECGYHRRDEELADAQRAILS